MSCHGCGRSHQRIVMSDATTLPKEFNAVRRSSFLSHTFPLTRPIVTLTHTHTRTRTHAYTHTHTHTHTHAYARAHAHVSRSTSRKLATGRCMFCFQLLGHQYRRARVDHLRSKSSLSNGKSRALIRLVSRPASTPHVTGGGAPSTNLIYPGGKYFAYTRRRRSVRRRTGLDVNPGQAATFFSDS
jgi:hypothetical protein